VRVIYAAGLDHEALDLDHEALDRRESDPSTSDSDNQQAQIHSIDRTDKSAAPKQLSLAQLSVALVQLGRWVTSGGIPFAPPPPPPKSP
jgi:hypothetical protein